jgi:hypothetical protein
MDDDYEMLQAIDAPVLAKYLRSLLATLATLPAEVGEIDAMHEASFPFRVIGGDEFLSEPMRAYNICREHRGVLLRLLKSQPTTGRGLPGREEIALKIYNPWVDVLLDAAKLSPHWHEHLTAADAILALFPTTAKQAGGEPELQHALCDTCDGKGWEETGDPDVGSRPMECMTCYGTGHFVHPDVRKAHAKHRLHLLKQIRDAATPSPQPERLPEGQGHDCEPDGHGRCVYCGGRVAPVQPERLVSREGE